MAKKSTTKAKTKTVKKVNVSKVTITKRSRLSFLQNISHEKLNKLSVVVYVLIAGLAIYLMSNISYEITLNYLTIDKLNAGAIVPAYRNFIDIELKWFVALIFGLAAVGPLMHATRMKRKYNLAVKARVMPWRWVETGVINALFASLVLMLLGFQDLATLKFVAFSLLLIAVLKWVIEKELLTNKSSALKLHKVELIATAFIILVLSSALLGTYLYGQIRAPWYVYSAFATFAVTLVLGSVNQYNQIRAHKNWKSYDNVERNYLLINLASRVSLAAILIAGFAK